MISNLRDEVDGEMYKIDGLWKGDLEKGLHCWTFFTCKWEQCRKEVGLSIGQARFEASIEMGTLQLK